ncbi:TrkH family potassium uptake protein [Shewanella acanthi]|uniref:TrkH family potassium uptake protein n=1 Tax=Shewanella acanthi TaxID=2864212 RepID=UPI001C6575CE|nr:TrkH family potassium uptake protein [Shewanella acanthi]QYJ78902.1 TrkH family potassium uptake protein [Shewanella acanthi]
MQYKTIIRIIGLLIGLFSTTMLPPALIAIWYNDGGGTAFIQAFFVSLFIGFWLWYPNRRCKEDLRTREGFLIVVLFWTVLGSIGALPFIFSKQPDLSWTDSFFESFSALTTTGATVIVGLDYLPKAILFYRHMLQWLGGMGIIVLAVAILPVLGIGGMQLYRAEIPGPVKDSKMTPRIAETAKALWYIYLLLTIACAGAYWLAGMSVFDAICHSFSTIAIGGFSTHDASMGYFDSSLINLICVFFLLVSAVNFSVHFAAFSRRGINLKVYFKDAEFKMLVLIQLVLTGICFITLYHSGIYDSPEETLDHALFQAVSVSTTAGFGTESFHVWPLFLPILLIFSSFIGGCGGSTAGGIKVIRVILLLLQGSRELKRLVHPKAMFSIRIGSKALPDRVVDAVWGFFSAYALVFVICMLALMAMGLDDITAFSATAACLNNLGPGLGEVASNYASIGDGAKWVLVVAMLFGRLEIFTLLILFTPTFWKD